MFEFWRKYLMIMSVIFALQGVGWALFGSFDPFGFYDGIWARAMFGAAELPADAARARSFLLGPFGATDAGFFILVYYIARYPFAARRLWAHRAITVAVGFWFLLDSLVSIAHGAFFNVYVVNLPALAMLAPPLFFTRRQFAAASGAGD